MSKYLLIFFTILLLNACGSEEALLTLNVPNNSSFSISSSSSIIVNENTSTGSTAFTIAVENLDNNNDRLFTYSLTPSTLFNITQQGVIQVKQHIDYESTQVHHALLTVSDGILNSTLLLSFNIKNFNDTKPSINNENNDITINENTPVNSTVFNITAVGNDGEADTALTYSLSPSTLFSINQQGIIQVKQNIDYESTKVHHALLTVRDGVFSTSQQLSFTINNLNDIAPSIISSAHSTSVNENTPINSTVFNMTAAGNDGEADTTLTYSLTPSTLFAINQQGVIQVKQNIDYESTQVHHALLTVYDGILNSTLLLSFNIKNFNDTKPSINNENNNITINENTPINNTVFNITAVGNDSEADTALTYSLTPSTLFSINQQGVIQVKQHIDYESTQVHHALLTVNDGAFSTSQQLSFTINNLNDIAPSIISSAHSTSVNENTPINSTVLNITAAGNDGEKDTTLTYSLTPSTLFAINQQGIILVKQNIDYESTQVHHALLTVNDGVFSTTRQLSFTINNLNDIAPSIINSAHSTSVNENTPINSTVLNITAAGNDGEKDTTLTYSLTPSTLFAINQQGIIQVKQNIDYESTQVHYALLTVHDGVFSTSQQLSFTINNLNDIAPSIINAVHSTSVNENTPINSTVLNITAAGNDGEANTALTYSLTPSTLFAINQQGIIQVKQNIDYESTQVHHAILTVNDGVFSTSRQLNFTINNLNDIAPSIINAVHSTSVNENTPINSTVLNITAAGNDGEADTTLTYSLTPSTLFAINQQGVIHVQQNIDYESAQVHHSLLTVNDGVFSTSQQLSFTINNLNDMAPSIINAVHSTSVNENTPINSTVFNITAAGNDGEKDATLTYSLTPSTLFAINQQGVIHVQQNIDYESTQVHHSLLTVHDGVLNSTRLLSFNIINLNDTTPSISISSANMYIQEKLPLSTVLATATIDIIDSSITSPTLLIDNNQFAINSAGEITAQTELNYLNSSKHYLVLSIQDDPFNSTQAITINVSTNRLLTHENHQINQGVAYQHALTPPTGLSNHFQPVFLSPLPHATSITLSNPDIHEITVLHHGTQTHFIVEYSFKDQQSNTQLHTTASLSYTVNSDPLRKHQWHLQNTGQTAFAGIGGTAGADINVANVHQQNITGENITVAIVDSGLQIDHEDLVDNVVLDGSYDFTDNDNDPTPSGAGGDHGTSVAGLVAMRGWNNIGGTGVAPMANLRGYNFIQNQGAQSLMASLGYGTEGGINSGSEQAHIFNMSLGFLPSVSSSYVGADLWRDTMRCGTTGNPNHSGSSSGIFSTCNALNSNKGAIYIKSAGNDFNGDIDSCNLQPNLSCEFVSGLDGIEVTPYVMVVAALNADGVKSSYSSAGPAVWFASFGGEFGKSDEALASFNQNFGTSYSYSGDDTKKSAMLTVDMSTCNRGYTENTQALTHNSIPYSIPHTLFHGKLIFQNNGTTSLERHAENQNCNYASTFNGTSSAAPVASGVAALVMSANTELYWRDVRYIMAKTARKVDANIAPLSINIGGEVQVLRTAWSTNTAGFSFHHWYGFGLIDASAAVDMAKSYTTYLTNDNFIQGNWIEGDVINSTITDNNIHGVTATVTVPSQGMQWIEGVQIRLSITHPSAADITAKLISPSGTESIILRAFNSLNDSNNFNDTLLYTNKFYRETDITGEWKLFITDNINGNEGRITNWKIRFFGEKE